MFACRDATELMTEEREGTLRGGKRFWYGFHMTICSECKRYRRQMLEAMELAREIPREEPPREVEDKLAAAFRARRG